MSIVQALLDQVQSEVEKSGQSGRVVSLQLVIGRLSGVHVDAIRLGFELLSPESIADGATLCIEQPKARCHCAACGANRRSRRSWTAVPPAAQAEITIRGGQELLLQSIELEE